jgi:hypothetical protein
VANEALVKNGTPIVWANSGDYSSTGSGYTRTHQMNPGGLGSDQAWQGVKADLGATRARVYAVYACVSFDSSPTAGGIVEVWWSESADATAGVGNTGGASGTDLGYTPDYEEWKEQLRRIGALAVTADNGVAERQFIGFLYPQQRYGMPIIINIANTDFTTDGIERYIAIVPLINEVQ